VDFINRWTKTLQWREHPWLLLQQQTPNYCTLLVAWAFTCSRLSVLLSILLSVNCWFQDFWDRMKDCTLDHKNLYPKTHQLHQSEAPSPVFCSLNLLALVGWLVSIIISRILHCLFKKNFHRACQTFHILSLFQHQKQVVKSKAKKIEVMANITDLPSPVPTSTKLLTRPSIVLTIR